MKKPLFPFSKIINNWELHFQNTSLEYFVLVLFIVVFITIYVSTCFSSPLDKGILVYLSLSSILRDWQKLGLWGKTCGLKRLGREGIWRGIFYGGTPKDTMGCRPGKMLQPQKYAFWEWSESQKTFYISWYLLPTFHNFALQIETYFGNCKCQWFGMDVWFFIYFRIKKFKKV